MDNFYIRKSHVPAFGSWDCNNDLPFTQCFESATQTGLFRYNSYSEDRDLYVSGDLYENDVVTPAVIVVPRRRKGERAEYSKEKEGKKDGWAVCDYDYDLKNGVSVAAAPPRRPGPKAVDEDLYKISPHLLRSRPRKKRAWGFFSSCCLRSTCVS